MMESIADRFQFNFESKLGSGAFGQVLKGYDTLTETDVAIKLELKDAKYPQVVQEAKLYRILEDDLGMPHVHWVG